MAFTSYGYDGSVTEGSWAKMQRFLGAMYGVDGPGDLKVTAKAGADRTVTIAAGTCGGHGVVDTETAAQDLAIPSVATGTRWDLIVVRREWETNDTTIARVEGGSQETTLPTRTTDPGNVDEQPLALVQVTAGSTAIGAIRDLRCWPGYGGYLAVHTLALQYLGRVGNRVRINEKEYIFRLNSNGTAGEWWWSTQSKILVQPTQPTYEEGLVWGQPT